jgi:hypothetical protein
MFITAMCTPGIVSLSKQAVLQIRYIDEEMIGRMHICTNFVDTYNYHSIGLHHRGIGSAFSLVDCTSAGPYPSMEELAITRDYKTPSGVKIEDIVEGDGLPAREGDMVELNYVCRRSNGYFVYSTVDQLSGESKPVTLSLGDKQIISGLKEVLVGMKAGGKRRAFIPPNVGYTSENLEPQPPEFGPRRSLLSHMKEPLVFEVQVLKVL